MIFGIGTDLVRIDRVRAAERRWGIRFARRILGPRELKEYSAYSAVVGLSREQLSFACDRDSVRRGAATRYLAKRFAAKEAFAKALGLGLRWPMTLHAIQIIRAEHGKPDVAAETALSQWMHERHLVPHISLSDEVDHALAFVVIEQSNY